MAELVAAIAGTLSIIIAVSHFGYHTFAQRRVLFSVVSTINGTEFLSVRITLTHLNVFLSYHTRLFRMLVSIYMLTAVV
ncbi:MAG TPA: hypothetical protein VLA40_00015 [Rheinheimera sp.]|nr:hypothetical protein [Rheinheimera sp.]